MANRCFAVCRTRALLLQIRAHDAANAFGRLPSSSDGIVAKHVGFQLQFLEPMFENIADAYDPHESVAVLDGRVADALFRRSRGGRKASRAASPSLALTLRQVLNHSPGWLYHSWDFS